ncbi:MAG: CHASE2 domain-containing protein [Blastochloris sp.]|nr:CHASE2 domain-containing protein [Blastochloris sp.]
MANDFQGKIPMWKKVLSYPVLAPLVLVMLLLGLDVFPIFRNIENITVDKRILERSKNQAAPDKRLLFVGIDDGSLADLQTSWPMSREFYGVFTRLITNGRPAVFSWDILWDRPSVDDEVFLEGMASTDIPMLLRQP